MTGRAWCLIGAAAALVVWWAWPSDRARIRESLDRLAEAASVPASEPPLATVARAAVLAELLAADIVISLGDRGPQLDGRDAVIAAATRAGTPMAPLQVRIAGADIALSGDGTAQARVAVQVSTPNRAAERVDEELLFDLAKQRSRWTITRVRLDRALTAPP